MSKKEDDDFNQKLWNLMIYGFWGNDKELDEVMPIFAVVAIVFIVGVLLYFVFK